MNQAAAHRREYTRNQADLYLAFELGNKEWKLGFSVGLASGLIEVLLRRSLRRGTQHG